MQKANLDSWMQICNNLHAEPNTVKSSLNSQINTLRANVRYIGIWKSA